MQEFCGSVLWDPDPWLTADPDFTECFQLTLLVWVPCAFLVLFTPLEFYFISKSKFNHIPWSFLNIMKLLATTLLIALSALDIGIAVTRMDDHPEEIFPVHYTTPSIRIVTFLLASYFVLVHRKKGIRSSGLLFIFWTGLMICAIPQYRTEIRYIMSRGDLDLDGLDGMSWRDFKAFSYMAYFPLVAIMFFLNCFADKRQVKTPKTKNTTPEYGSSFLRKILFQWYDIFMWHGYKTPIEAENVWDLMDDDLTKNVAPDFDHYWYENVEKNRQKMENNKRKGKSPKEGEPMKPGETNGSILGPMFKAFGGPFWLAGLYKVFIDLLGFVSPQLLGLLIAFTANSEQPLWNGFAYAVGLFAVAVLIALLNGQHSYNCYRVGFRIRSAVISAIYRKAMRISSAAKKDSTVGEIVNLMAVDAQKFFEMMPYLHFIWSGPLVIALALYFLYDLLGAAIFAGLGVMLIVIPFNIWIATKLRALQVQQMKKKDVRVKVMNEILNGMKVLKLYAWEPSFEDNIKDIRASEIELLKVMAIYSALTFFFWSITPFLVALACFTTYVLMDENNVLDSQTAFTSLSLLNVLMTPMLLFPMAISMITQAWVSIVRINKFMNNPELKPDNVSHEKSTEALSIKNGTFSWDSDDVTLKDINLEVTKGSLTAVVGPVGSGKSSLVAALLGEMDKKSGTVNTDGSIAYVAQQAWIQNATLQNNILFGRPMNRSYYDKVVHACALKPDIEMLPGGDQTEIGEKGINLSGGQKQRIALARAVYANADIYVLDDPLSAVDAHVGKHIFDYVIGPKGMLVGKTRLLVTHAVSLLPQIDMIYVLSNGVISESGHYKSLLNQKGAFSEFLLQHISDMDDEEELKEIQKALGEKPEAKALLQRAMSIRSTSSSGSIRSRKRSRTTSVNSKIEEEKPVAAGTRLIEKEESASGSVSIQVYGKYFKSIGTFSTILILSMYAASQGFSIGSNLWLTRWSSDEDAALPENRDMYLGVYGALGGGQALMLFIGSIVFGLGALTASKTLHNLLLKTSFRLPMSFFDTTPLGRIMNRFSKDVDIVDITLPNAVRMWIQFFFNVVAVLIVISISTPIFMSVIVPLGIFYYFVQSFYITTSRQLKRVESVTRSPIYSHFGESITGQQTIRAYNKQVPFMTENADRVDFNQKSAYSSIIANRWLGVRLEIVGSFIVLFAAIFAVLGRDDMDPGIVGLSISYSLTITQVLAFFVRMTADVETNIVAIERMEEYESVEKEADWKRGNIDPIWPKDGAVHFEDLKIRYREGLDLVLKGITFRVNPQEKIGIVGRTGAGKSSLTLALFRIVEAAGGKIIIDGKDIAEMGLHNLRSRLTIIPQDPVLFSGSLRMNIDPFNHYTDDDIWRVLEHSHLKTFVKSLPTGILHEISEGGENLSVGQRQLICLARALLRKTKVLVLDEATAAVDLETDDLIQKTIRTEFADCTILTIAHRLNTIIDSDKVVVLDKGEIAEFDTPDNLLNNPNTIFHSMAKNAGIVMPNGNSSNDKKSM